MAATRSTRRGVQALVATGGVVAVMSSGIAFAASGHAPWSPAPASSAGQHGALASDESPSSPESTAPTSGPTTAPAARTHGLRGLCHAYAAGNKAEKGRALASPAFVGLVAAAGGADAVPGFCAVVLTTAHDASSASTDASDVTRPAHPTHPAHPTQPTQGADPTHPAHPSPPVHPTERAEPTQPARPVQPTQAADPTHPAPPAHS